MLHNAILKYAGRTALIALITIYFQAISRGDLITNKNWTISRVMVYKYNQNITHWILFPCFLIICIVYALKYNLLRIRIGSGVAILGSFGLIYHPVTTSSFYHLVSAGIVFLSSYFWYLECNSVQLKVFLVSSIFFIGGFVFDRIFIDSYAPSICCMIGELGIFITWGLMVQNNTKGTKSNKVA